MTTQLAERRAPDGALPRLHPVGPDDTTERQLCLSDPRDSVIERTALRLRQLVCTTTMELTLKVGAVIIEDLYGGSLKAWRKRGRKCHSLRALANQPDLPMSAASIYRSVAIYELVTRARGIETFSRLGVGHFRAVLAVSTDEQLGYLRTAHEQAWTVSELEHRTRPNVQAEGRPRGGRRPLHPVFRALRTAARALDGELRERSDLGTRVDGPHVAAIRSEVETLLRRILSLAEVVGVATPLQAHADRPGMTPNSRDVEPAEQGRLR